MTISFWSLAQSNETKVYTQSEIQQQKKEMLKLGYWDFDQSEKGWRSLGEGKGKDSEIAELVDEYMTEDWIAQLSSQ